jgi:hypothetical protein
VTVQDHFEPSIVQSDDGTFKVVFPDGTVLSHLRESEACKICNWLMDKPIERKQA